MIGPRHKYQIFARRQNDEPVLLETVEAKLEPHKCLMRARIQFSKQWDVWMERIPSAHPSDAGGHFA